MATDYTDYTEGDYKKQAFGTKVFDEQAKDRIAWAAILLGSVGALFLLLGIFSLKRRLSA